MKIPEYVRIQGVDYRVEFGDVVTDGRNVLMGCIEYPECRIQLSETACPNEQTKLLTLWHEILHGICYASGMQLQNEEEIVEMMSRGVYQVIQDNIDQFFDVVEVEENNGSEDQGTCCAVE